VIQKIQLIKDGVTESRIEVLRLRLVYFDTKIIINTLRPYLRTNVHSTLILTGPVEESSKMTSKYPSTTKVCYRPGTDISE